MLPIIIPAVIGIFLLFYILKLRRIVPTNMVHIIQQGKDTISYGVGKTSNVYYEWPSWIPRIGVDVRELPVSNFDIDLSDYSAYDKDRVPFVVDVKAFFHIADTNIAAAKVASYTELKEQLENIVQGAVRSILAKQPLELIMEERSVFGQQFTDSVNDDLKNWGVASIKNIELMDVRDSQGSEVIHQIMAKRMSAIDMESRTEVASNNRQAEEAELEARKKVAVKAAQTQRESGEAEAQSKQAIGIAMAESAKMSGIADQKALSQVAEAAKITAEKDMEVVSVNTIRQAEIDKEAAIISAEEQKTTEIINAEKEKKKIEVQTDADKYRVETNATAHKIKVETEALAKLEAEKNEAEGSQRIGEAEAAVILAKGESTASALKSEQLASVTAQTELAKEIGENEGYQKYLIDVKNVDANQVVEVAKAEALATALAGADLKILTNSGDVKSGVNSLGDLLSSKGGSSVNGLLESLKQTEEGKGLLAMLNNFTGKGDNA
jgi:flotillin